MEAEKMDRGTASLSEVLRDVQKLDIQHDRRGWLQETLCCSAKSDFRYYNGEKQLAESKEEFSHCCRCCFAPHHFFDMSVKAAESDSEVIHFNRTCRLPMGPCKICCYQQGTISSGEESLGEVKESFWCCVPQWKVYDSNENPIYTIHPPTCCCGLCIDCCVEGNCCPFGCCLIPCRIYPADQQETSGDAPFIGRMAKVPKESLRDVYNETSYAELEFPEGSSPQQKGLLLGAHLLINALFFENSE